MPFTPYHAGPNGLVGLLLYRWVNLPAIILVNIAVDLEPLIIILFKITKYPEHGFFHSYGGAMIISLLFVMVYEKIKKPMGLLMSAIGLKQDNSFFSVVLGAVIGGAMHVTMDSMIYRDIMPLYPFEYNPIYGMMKPSQLRLFCLACFAASVVVYFVRKFLKDKVIKPKA